ncbi:MAG TPA: ankyrin repeat domain-containing protein [Blastocatellia bacterium]|nr:ankyrin repeat domain-containing protein [Blastocatellia bacterium]
MSIKVKSILILLLALSIPRGALAQESENTEKLMAAARKGDVATLKALLDAGADVNSKTRYGATALSFAADKGNVEVVRLLLERGADVDVKDTFYGATPLSWAVGKGHTDIVRALVEKGAKDLDQALIFAANNRHVDIVKIILEKKKVSAQALSAALSNAEKNNFPDVADLLKAAGAVPPPKADFAVDAETLKRYAGRYRSDAAGELSFELKDGKLVGTSGGQQFPMEFLDKATSRPAGAPNVTVKFNEEGGKVVSFTLKQGGGEFVFKRVEEKQ